MDNSSPKIYTEFLPINRADMEARGWEQLDFVVVGGDAYVDHPSFGTAIISRLLEAEGYKIGVLAQPRYTDCEDFKRFGKPKYGFFIGGGNVAMDVARELMRNADDLKERTDIPDNVYEGIKANKAKTLHLFIRRGVAQAKFSVQELREMEKLPGVQLIINEDDFDLDDDTIEEAGKDKLTRQMVEEF